MSLPMGAIVVLLINVCADIQMLLVIGGPVEYCSGEGEDRQGVYREDDRRRKHLQGQIWPIDS